VTQIAAALPISRPAVSRHLRLLKQAGLVAEHPQGTRRIYHLEQDGLRAVQAYLEQVWGEAARRFRLYAENTRDATSRRRSPMAAGTKDDPWALKTPPGTSGYTMYRDDDVLVCQVGSTTLKYQFRAVDDLHDWLAKQGDWVPLGAADEGKPAADGTVEAFGRAADNPVGGWYGLRKGYRGRFGMYLPPLLEALGLAELTHDARNNKIRAL
jgi:uncharacterized protein DUF6855/regulatory ArsR family protein